MRALAANAFTLLIVLGLAAAGLAAYGQRMFTGPGPHQEERVFVAPRGATLDQIAERLEAEELISSARLFRIGARYAGKAGALRFGEYRVPAGASMREILDLLASGRSIQYAITIPEGLTSWEVVEVLRASDLLSGEIDSIPAEGALAPETYSVQRGDSRAALLERMQDLQRRTLALAWEGRADGLTLRSPEEALVLASLIEKETGQPGERGLVSAVFHNRLRQGMRLQSDPTIIYGITEGRGPLGRDIRRSDITRATAWNTYAIDGLPPTPIANPGRDAIVAAVRPDASDALYFVADGTGGHAFARTLAEHNRNVAAWRAIERSRAAE
ncbi:MAG: endolytic transglycosylase MltG [Rubrimonas sp.]|uniref:endolytic transglycosylase MltG n=1 Tax=Rubrimonas sp. TaxID=2036015 RepID=UPI002FDC880A